nr:immunoglobulin light chain junction region [Macaca mulatta]MPN85170.1 immunoglobulin light chain junction region [Macaca mulatta]MPN85189.1 immunoglobulin light chain junction region [Macaca mulatta]MPN85191.1 immunoglobulin light chain junction region [Macaca mulatta]MPN85195.1 immunoglobulin light chain junction region [Macaca mulatta]
CLLYFIGARVF